MDEELGGSALYFSLAASLLTPVALSAPVGREDEVAVRGVVAGRPVDLSRLTVVDAPTYRWSARQAAGTNIDGGSRDSIYDVWTPDLPSDYAGWAFVGSMRPDRQAEAGAALESATLLAGDSMRSYVAALPAAALDLLGSCDWFFCNEEELAALGGDADRPEEFRERAGLRGLVVKAGPRGASLWTRSGRIHVGAAKSLPVVDVTGAGDALAGGFLARWLSTGGEGSGLLDALRHGTACAALAISDIGLRGLVRATRADLDQVIRRLS